MKPRTDPLCFLSVLALAPQLDEPEGLQGFDVTHLNPFKDKCWGLEVLGDDPCVSYSESNACIQRYFLSFHFTVRQFSFFCVTWFRVH